MNKKTIILASASVLCACSLHGAVYHINIGGDINPAGDDFNAVDYTTSNLGFDVDGDSINDTVAEVGVIFNSVIIDDSTGSNAAGVTFQIEGWQGNNPAEGNGNGIGYPNVGDAYTSSLAFGFNNHQVTIANLNPASTYTVEVFGGLTGGAAGLDYSMTVNGSAAQTGTMGTLYASASPVTFTGVSVIASGTTQDGDSVSNYIQLDNASTVGNPITQFVRITEVPVPEPSSTLLIGLGALSFLLRRNRV